MFDKLININYESGKIGVEGLVEGLEPIFLLDLYKKTNRPLLVLTNTLYEANKIYDSLYNYTEDVLLFPMDDFITTKIATVSPELKTIRLSTEQTLLENNNKIVVTHLMGYLKFLDSKEKTKNRIFKLKKGNIYNREDLINSLYELGYANETIVTQTGEFALRGYIIDIFPINEENPIRLEFFDDELDNIRYFDCNSQRSINEIENININSIKEKDNNDGESIKSYLDNPILIYYDYNQIKSGYEQLLAQIFEYNTNNNCSDKHINDFYSLSEKDEIYIMKTANIIPGINLKINKIHSENAKIYNGKNKLILDDIKMYLESNKTIVVCLDSKKQIDNFKKYIYEESVITDENKIFDKYVNLINKNIIKGFCYDKYIVISSNDLYGTQENKHNFKNKYKYGTRIKDINKLNIGDYVVHNAHGIGIYAGLETINNRGVIKDYLKILYKDNDALYIPVDKIDLISKYSSNEGAKPKINKLGGTEWEKKKNSIRKKVKDIAQDLLKLYAKRESEKGFAFSKDSEEQIMFEQEFPYTPTNDQLIATKQIKEDMEASHPMDRLLCGDVGFGKTEVAFRAIFKAIMDGKQVAYLCPTTILSSQHYKNALERFKSFPVNIALLNRFVSRKEQIKIIEGIKNGTIDFVIGTHRLLGKDINFKDLGLLVVDEEQRFGVTHKEKIKAMKSNVDVLTLSATPIPRTLQMSIVGIRNLSLIETAPINRYPVQTYVVEEDNKIIVDAIYKELSRGGQIFLLYNHVDDIINKYYEISQLVKEAKITYAHGRMQKTELEDRMQDFIDKKYDILICTTIIETGIDIPNVNTLIIIDADRFGLAQLYQIRGRVGRSDKIGYAYLMYKKDKIINEIATKRLNVIKDFTELGSGFSIAMRDLSIRGAGDILGSEQAGFIDTVGIELYTKMLNEEIAKLKGEKVEEENTNDKSLIDVSTYISDDYVSDASLKIEIHNKINEIDSYDKLIKTRAEIEDRFGKINDDMLIYMYEEWLEKISNSIGVERYIQSKNSVTCILSTETSNNINGEKLFYLANDISRMFRFSYKDNKIYIILDTIKLEKNWIFYMIELLNQFNKFKKV